MRDELALLEDRCKVNFPDCSVVEEQSHIALIDPCLLLASEVDVRGDFCDYMWECSTTHQFERRIRGLVNFVSHEFAI